MVTKIRDLPFDDDLREVMASFPDILSVPNATYIRIPNESIIPVQFSSYGFDQESAIARVVEHQEHNIWHKVIKENNLSNGFAILSDYYSWEGYTGSFWYNQVAGPENLCDAMNLTTIDPIQGETHLAWYTDASQGRFSRRSIDTLRPYYRMLKKSLDLRMALDERDLELAFFNDVANKSEAFALCYLNGEVVGADSAFERVLANKEGLSLVRHRIQPIDRQSQQVWQQQWVLATQQADINAETPSPFQIRRAQKLQPLVAEMWAYQHKGGTVLKSETTS